MSLFYGKDPQRPDQQDENADIPKKNQQNMIKQKQEVGSRGSIFLKKDQQQNEAGCCHKCCNNCCSCLSCDSLKQYFTVTNKDIAKRIGTNIKFWSGGFFTPAQQQYDLYGPFWLYTTMIFVVGAVRNILIYQNNHNNFQYDYDVFKKSLTVFYVLGFLLSALIGLIFSCLGLQSKTSQIVCLYGYSMSTYIICVSLCSFNMTLLTWGLLVYAAIAKVVYILKNTFESLQVPTAKKFILTVIVIAEAAFQMLLIKFIFIKTNNDGSLTGAFSHMQAGHLGSNIGVLHPRQFMLQ